MSRITRKEIACPRGRHKVIQFPAPRPSIKAKPILRYHTYIIANGIPVHVIGERWRKEDASSCRSSTFPDPSNPAIVLAMRVESVAGVAIRVVSCEEYHALAEAIRLGSPARMAGTGSG